MYDQKLKRLQELHKEIGELRMSELMMAVASGEVYRLDKNASVELKKRIHEALLLAGEVQTIREFDEIIRGQY
jgi:hypothetical protein